MLNADDEVASQNSDGDPMPDVIKARENGECCHMVIFISNYPKKILIFTNNKAWPKTI